MSLSRSERNIVALLSMCMGISVMITARYEKLGRNSQRLTKLLEKLKFTAKEGLNLWTGTTELNDVKHLHAILEEFEKETLPEGGHISIWTSAVLGIIEDITPFITNPTRQTLLEDLRKCVERIHEYFDRHGKRTDDYQKATKAVTVWNHLVTNPPVSKKKVANLQTIIERHATVYSNCS